MEIRFYTPDMDFKGLIENQGSLVWTRKYFEPGEFELHVPITEKNMEYIKLDNLIWKKGSEEAGVIEDRQLEENSTNRTIVAKGRFLSSYMDRRLIKSTVNFSGKVEVAMRQLLSGAVEIPGVVLGDLQGFTEAVTFQATYKNLLTYIEKLGRSSGLGFRFRPDFNEKKIYFEVYKGIDRTASQIITNRVTFSESYANLNNAILRENNQLYKNVAYVGGEGEGSQRVYVQVGSAEGLNLREVFVDARDLRSDEIGAEEYRAQLTQRGLDELAKDAMSRSLECDTGANVNFVYRKDYDLGDIVTVEKKAWGVQENLRITEIQEVYEYGEMKVVPTLGTAIPETIDWSDD